MTDFRASGASEPIASVDRLLEEFHRAGKPRESWMIGTEWEKLAVDARTGVAAPFSGPNGIERLLRMLAERYGWEPQEEEGRVIALLRDGASITLEPGGQVELSGQQCPTVHCTKDELDVHVRELASVGDELGIAFLGLGMQPVSTLDDIEWVPKQRYRVMRAYMQQVGTLGHRMMKQTATVQANIDFGDERDAMRKMRVGMGTSPLFNAIFANSSVSEGELNGMMSYRGYVWTDTDRARCGLLPFCFRDGATFAEYADWALDVPMYFILRKGRYLTDGISGIPFRVFLERGLAGERATLDDWKLHLTTLFPEVRLKGYIEFRSTDSQPPDRVLALPALARGIFYVDDCLDAALDLVKRWSFDDCVEIYRDVTRDALKARARGIPVLELARELLAIAEEGLRRLDRRNAAGEDERVYLERMREQIATGRSPARTVAEKWNGDWDAGIDRLIDYTAIRGVR